MRAGAFGWCAALAAMIWSPAWAGSTGPADRATDGRAQDQPAATGEIYVNTSIGDLYLVQEATGSATYVMTAPQFFDIALDRQGRMFGVTAQGELYRVFPEDGAYRRVGNTGVFVNGLTFDAAGTLLATGYDRLYTLDTETGRATPIAVFPGFNSSGDLTVAPDGALYATTSTGPDAEDAVVRIDPARQNLLLLGGGTGFRNVYGLVWRNGRLIGVTEARELIAIDVADGSGTLLTTLPIRGWGYGAARAHDMATSAAPGPGMAHIADDRQRRARDRPSRSVARPLSVN